MTDAVVVRNLSKTFEHVQAVAGISFTVHRGELFGFLGPNGAGKTTTINLLTGLARPDAGSIHMGGIDCTNRPRVAQHLIGVVPDESNLYPELTGFENLCFCGALCGLQKAKRQKRARELLESFALAGASDRKFAGYSKGMKRKLTIAAGIIHEPDILFLDEPTTGIDVASARQLVQLVAELHDRGTTIFLTTHYIEEAERLCDRIAFIVFGRIVRIDTVEHLVQPDQEKHVVRISFATTPGDLRDGLHESFPNLGFTFTGNNVLRVESDSPVRVGPLIRFLEEHGAEVSEARRMRPSLEDVFVEITGIQAGRPCARRKRRREAFNEALDRLPEHPQERPADLLPEAAEHKLGAHLPSGVDGNVLRQTRKRPREHPRTPSGRRRRLGPLRHHVDAGGDSHIREEEPVVRATAAGARSARAPDAGQDERGDPLRRRQRIRAGHHGVVPRRFVATRLGCVRPGRLPDRRGVDVPWTLHRRRRERGLRGADLLQLPPLPDDLPCGLFFPVARLPVFLRPRSYALPLTYGADLLHGSVHGDHVMPFALSFAILGAFCLVLFAASLRNIKRKWIV